MKSGFSSQRSAAIREELVNTVQETTRSNLNRRARRWGPQLALVAAGMIVGGAVSAAAITITSPDPGGDALPGQPVVTQLGEVKTLVISESQSVPLLDIPDDATHVRVTVTCLSKGVTTWGLDPAGNNPSTACTEDDTGQDSWFDFELTPSTNNLYIGVGAGVESRISFQYLNLIGTPWGVNSAGETYGTEKDGQEPELIAVSGRNTNGDHISGYVRSSDLSSFGPDWPGQPMNPEQAIEWQEERDLAYPDGWDIPVYKSDGQSQIGKFRIGN